MSKILYVDVLMEKEQNVINLPELRIGKVDFYFTPIDTDNWAVLGRAVRKAIYIDKGYGKDYIITSNNKRNLISELWPAFGLYLTSGETDKTVTNIIKELKEGKNFDDIFTE